MSFEAVAPVSKAKADISNPLAVASVLALAVALTTILVSWVVLNSVHHAQMNQAEKLLRSELISRKDRVQSYLQAIARDLQNLASSRVSNIILSELESSFNEFGDQAMESLQAAYITNNPNPIGRKQALLQANDGSQYSAIHGKYHDWFSQLSDSHDYYDLFMISASGDVLYTVYKEDDFASNLNTGKYRETELAKTFTDLRDDPRPRSVVFRDFNPYLPSGDIPAAFIGSPVILDGQFQGALVAQLKLDPFNQLLRQSREPGIGPETYIVGPDNLLRSTSLVKVSGPIQQTTINSASVSAALANTSGITQTSNLRGRDVLSAYAPLIWNDMRWATLVELEMEEINQPLVQLRYRLFSIGIMLVLLAFLAGWLLADNRPRSACD